MPIEDSNNNAKKWAGRYWILLFDCTMVLGTYFCIDVPSALQSQLQKKQVNCSSENEIQNRNCCSECLGLGPDKYNQLYAIFSLTNAIVVFPAGIFIDRFGNRVSSLLFSGLSLVGSVLFAMAVMTGIRGTRFMFILMMIGRMLIGAGTGSSVIVQNCVGFVWFWDKVALVFGVLTSTNRIGSVLNFLFTSRVSVDYGISWALWLGAGMCFIGFISAIIFSFIDQHGSTRFNIEKTTSSSSSSVTKDVVYKTLPHGYFGSLSSSDSTTLSSNTFETLKEIRTFPAAFWILCAMIATFYSFLVPFIANGSKFLEDTYGYDRTKAAYINGILYETSILICPVVGQVNEKYGQRISFTTIGSFFTIIVLLLMLFTGLSPIICYVIMGLLYCMAVISIWPCVALIVPFKYVGTANGIAALLQYASVGLTSFGIGKILGHIEGTSEEHRQWLYVIIVFIGHLSVTSICGVVLLIFDHKMGHQLNKPTVKFKYLDVTETEYLIQSPD